MSAAPWGWQRRSRQTSDVDHGSDRRATAPPTDVGSQVSSPFSTLTHGTTTPVARGTLIAGTFIPKAAPVVPACLGTFPASRFPSADARRFASDVSPSTTIAEVLYNAPLYITVPRYRFVWFCTNNPMARHLKRGTPSRHRFGIRERSPTFSLGYNPPLPPCLL